jgi:excisionase family DNA binding protein
MRTHPKTVVKELHLMKSVRIVIPPEKLAEALAKYFTQPLIKMLERQEEPVNAPAEQQDPALEDLPTVLTAQDIAKYLRINVRRVYDNLQLKPSAGGIPHVRIGKQMRIQKSDFIVWMDQQKYV